MDVSLTPQSEELLRIALARHPDQSPAEIIESALAERAQRESAQTPKGSKRTLEEFRAWLDEFTVYSDKIPSLPGETFSRRMIYREHD